MSVVHAQAGEQPVEAPANSIWTRPGLLDGPGTFREVLRNHGIDIRASWTQFGQSLIQGDGDHSTEWGGKGDLIINLDGEKLGLWPGFSVNIHQEVLAGDDALAQGDGSYIPVNTALAFPRLGDEEADTSILISQRITDKITATFGKFNMLDAAARTPLLGGGGLNTFMNTALAAPISGVTPPYIVGGSLSIATKPLSFSIFVYDPRNAQDWDVVTNPFSEGVTLSVSSTLSTSFFGLPGFYSMRGVLSTDEGTDLRDIPQLILPSGSPTSVGTANNRWYVSVSAQQYLWQNPDDPSKGWGVFGQIGLSDENPTVVGTSFFVGLGGNAMFKDHPNDRWGVGYFRYQLSDVLTSALAAPPINTSFGPEAGIEAYYTHEFTPWLEVTADLQWLNGFEVDGDDSVFASLRTKIDF